MRASTSTAPDRRRKIVIATLAASVAAIAIVIAGAWWTGARLIAPARATIGLPPAGLSVETVSFASASGAVLSGWDVAGRPACPTIILMHGIRSNRLEMAGRAAFLARLGYNLLLFDFQAHGESTGERITFGYLERHDVRAAVDFVTARRPGTRIGAIGVSLGGAAALLAEPKLPLAAAVLESVYPTVAEAGYNRVEMRLGPLAHVLTPLLLVQLRWRLGFSPDDLRPTDRIVAFGAPLLIVAGTEDRHTTLAQSQRLFANASVPKELWEVTGAAHIDFHRHARAEYERRIGAFFARHMPCA